MKTKPALNLLIYTKELQLEESGILWIEARSGDVAEQYAMDSWYGTTDVLHRDAANNLAAEHGETIEAEIQKLNGGRIYRLARKES